MTRLRAISSAFIALCGVLLAGCGTDPVGEGRYAILSDTVLENLKPGGGSPEARPDRANISRAAISNLNVTLALAELPDVDAIATVTVWATKGNTVTWRTADEVSLTMNGPVLFATRGIGPDLLTAETAPLEALLRQNRGGTISRQYRHLNGLGQIAVTQFSCTVDAEGAAIVTVVERQHQTSRFTETCRADSGDLIENQYWIGTDGIAWKSRQWVSEDAGYLTFERLNR